MDLIKLVQEEGAELRGREEAHNKEQKLMIAAEVEATNVNYVCHFRSSKMHKKTKLINRLLVDSSCRHHIKTTELCRHGRRFSKYANNNNNDNDKNESQAKKRNKAIANDRSINSKAPVAVLLALCAVVALILSFSSSSSTLVNAARLQPEGQTKFYWSGEKFVITCQNNNNLKNVKIRWAGPDGKPITEDRSKRVHAETGGPHVSRLVVHDAQLDQDQGQYVCTISDAENRRSPDRANFTLNLLRATSFLDTRSKLPLDTGKEEHIECKVDFDPNVSSGTVNWYKDHHPIDAYNDSSYRVLDYNPETKMSKLVLSPVRREHEGNYTCQAQAVAAHLEKVLDFAIQVETQFAPIFDQPEQTIWVESSQAMLSRGAQMATHNGGAGGGGGNKYKSSSSSRPSRPSPKGRLGGSGGESAGGGGGVEMNESSNNETIIRVELKCACQANPSANILWYTEAAGRMAVTRGQPAHVIEEPTTQVHGHESQSTLVIAYNLDVNWAHRYDTYKCSAANKLNGASKIFTIVQGNPPPAYTVGAQKAYNPQTTEFQFSLVAPNFDPLATGSQSGARGEHKDVMPPVDSFRIRAEFATTAATAAAGGADAKLNTPGNRQATVHNQPEVARRLAEPSVEWAASIVPSLTAQNMSVKLGKLPSGLQRLYLEAHNAVGWSPNSTLLGEFNLISGATSTMSTNFLLMLTCLLITLLSQRFNN